MSSYLSNILTNTTSKYNSLRQTLTSSEADGDTEDDSHISRVLRAYYTEKSRQLPDWLPPDPRQQRSINTQSVASTFTSSLRQGGGSNGSTSTIGQHQQPSKNSLSDLWDQPAQRAASPQPPLSLRRQAAERSGTSFQGRAREGDGLQAPTHARPLPSQRAGSYQSQMSQYQIAQGQGQGAYSDPAPPQSSGGLSSTSASTAQERLKARLWGSSRNGSSTSLAGSAGQLSPQQQPSDGHGNRSARDRFAHNGSR